MALGTLRLKTIELEGEISYLTKASVPIGFTYIQFPGKSEPSVLYYGVWANVSDEYPGDFFRVEGGVAETFDSDNLTEQLDQMQRITGEGPADDSGTHSIPYDGAFSFASGGDGPWDVGAGGKFYFDSADSPDARTSTTTDGETFPVNRTIRIWERVEA